MKKLSIEEKLIPELKESEDERIRQFLIHEVTETSDEIMSYRNMNKKDVLSWLEKQGEQKTVDEIAKEVCKNRASATAFLKSAGIMNEKGELAEQYRQDEQKPDDKIEPKFHEGEWIVFNGLILYVNEVVQGYYRTTSIGGIPNSYDWDIDNVARLWTIQEAKDGDVLFLDLMCGKTFIYNGISPDMAILYSFIISNDGEDVLPYHIGKPNTGIGNIEESKNIIHPATKEQRDLLFAKMKEAGYEWDADKKELKKKNLIKKR